MGAGAEETTPPSSSRRPDELAKVGDRVTVAGQRRGTVRFVGETKFAKGKGGKGKGGKKLLKVNGSRHV